MLRIIKWAKPLTVLGRKPACLHSYPFAQCTHLPVMLLIHLDVVAGNIAQARCDLRDPCRRFSASPLHVKVQNQLEVIDLDQTGNAGNGRRVNAGPGKDRCCGP